MKNINLPITSNKLQFLQKTGVPHIAYFTNSSTTIKLINEDITYFLAPQFLKKSDLGFVKRVKDFAKTTGLPDTGITSSDITYFRFNDVAEDDRRDVVEIDVNKAYWQLAYQNGYLPQHLYEQGLNTDKVGKLTRLVALGSLASKKKVFQFDGKNYHFIGYKFDPVLRSYFFKVSYDLDNIMNDIFNQVGERALFYWFDAFFVNREVADYIEREIGRYGLGVKRQEIKEVKKVKSDTFDYLKISDNHKGAPRIRTFALPNLEAQLSFIQSYAI